jgi:single-strand DNA-binding protein
MAQDINFVLQLGRIGRDPIFKDENGTVPMLKFSLATRKEWKKQGQRQEKTNWHQCVMFGKQAEVAAKYLKKSSYIWVKAELDYYEYTKPDGSKKEGSQLLVNSWGFLGSNHEKEETTTLNGSEDAGLPWD